MAGRDFAAVGQVGGSGVYRGDGRMGRGKQAGSAALGALNVINFAKAFDDLLKRAMWVANAILILGLLSVAWFAMDREPPFAVLSVEPASALPGQWVKLRGEVRRDLHRKCASDFSRYIFDSEGVRFDLGNASASAAMIERIDRSDPGHLTIAFQVPATIHPGKAELVTVLEYACNKVHRFWPIEVLTTMPFTVLEP